MSIFGIYAHLWHLNLAFEQTLAALLGCDSHSGVHNFVPGSPLGQINYEGAHGIAQIPPHTLLDQTYDQKFGHKSHLCITVDHRISHASTGVNFSKHARCWIRKFVFLELFGRKRFDRE